MKNPMIFLALAALPSVGLAADVSELFATQVRQILKLRHRFYEIVDRKAAGLVTNVGAAGLSSGDRAACREHFDFGQSPRGGSRCQEYEGNEGYFQ